MGKVNPDFFLFHAVLLDRLDGRNERVRPVTFLQTNIDLGNTKLAIGEILLHSLD